ncbi:MAG: SMC-Scp complex subunit ScpB [Firmicutes bacterium]|nr:SMC-Scp complex subunit ScpB [Bacillota bacterium]
MIWDFGKAVVEALLLASPEPLTAARIAEVLGVEEREARILIDDLRRDYQAPGRGLAIREVAGGYQLVTRPELADYVERLLAPKGRGLSPAALETLAIIAYRQPITRAEIEAVRGVSVERILDNLLERRLIREVGRRDGPGRPILYGTTQEFLTYFGLKDLSELPPVEPRAEGQSLLRRLDAERGSRD